MGVEDRNFIGIEIGMLVSSFGRGIKHDITNLSKRLCALCEVARTEGRNKSSTIPDGAQTIPMHG